MATSWPSVSRSDYDANTPTRKERAEALRDRDVCLMRRPMFVNISEQAETATGYAVQAEFTVWVPDYASGNKLAMILDAKVASDTGDWKLREKASATDGTEVSVTGTSYAESGPSEVTIDASWVDSERTFEILSKVDAGTGTIYLKATDIAAVYWTD